MTPTPTVRRSPAPGRRSPTLRAAVGALAIALAAGVSPRASAQDVRGGDATAELLGAVNALRVDAGLAPLRAEPALAAVAARAAAGASGAADLAVAQTDPTEVTRQIRRAGYRPHAWRQRLVQGPRDAAAVLRHWRESDPATYSQVVLGDYEVLGAARAPGVDPPLWSLIVASPHATWALRQGAPLDDLGGVRATILAQLNAARAASRLPPVVAQPRLDGVAQEYARDMLARGFYDHRSPEGSGPAQRASAAGYRFRWVAENLAKGLFPHDEVVGRWMGSSGHRRNILDRHAEEVGIGVAWGEERNGEHVALWVLVLASPG